MKAIVYTKYGPPDVLQLKEVEKPSPKENEVLIKIHAAALNQGDWYALTGKPFMVRLTGGLLKPKDKILGMDVAGRVLVRASPAEQRTARANSESACAKWSTCKSRNNSLDRSPVVDPVNVVSSRRRHDPSSIRVRADGTSFRRSRPQPPSRRARPGR